MTDPSQPMPLEIAHRYRLIKQIGIGGMGAVYHAYDRLTGTAVALKRVRVSMPEVAVKTSTQRTVGSPELRMATLNHTAPTLYNAEIAEWQHTMDSKLRAEDGWLTLIGLHWLHEGLPPCAFNHYAPCPLAPPENTLPVAVEAGERW